jgi:hypothetical protein
MLKNSLKFHFELQNFLKEFSVIFLNYLAFKSFLNNFLDFKNNSEKRNFYSNPVRPTAFGPHANLLLPVSSGPTGPAGPPDGRLLPHAKVVAELHSAPPPRQADMAATPSPALPSLDGLPLPLLNLIYNRNLQPLFPPRPFNSCCRPLPRSTPQCSFP